MRCPLATVPSLEPGTSTDPFAALPLVLLAPFPLLRRPALPTLGRFVPGPSPCLLPPFTHKPSPATE